TVDGVEIRFTGEQLNQDDHDLLMTLVFLTRTPVLGKWVTVSAYAILGSVSKVEMIPLHCPSKGIAVDKQANDEVVHLCGFREANGLTDQAFNARPQGQMRALDLLRILFAWAVDSGGEMTRVGTPIIRIIACDPKGFQQGF